MPRRCYAVPVVWRVAFGKAAHVALGGVLATLCASLATSASQTSPDVQARGHASVDEAAATQEIRALMERQVTSAFRSDGKPARRDAHAKAQGCVRAHFTVAPGLPPGFRQGVFAEPHAYTAWIRFSNAAGTEDRASLARGMAIKLTGVPGRKILADEATETTQDFLLVNYPIFNVKTASEYVDFFKASTSGTLPAFFAQHPAAGAITAAIAGQHVSNPLLQRYFSMRPYALGSRYAKYSARPISCANGKALHDATTGPLPTGPNYLRAAMAATLSAHAGCFSFGIQLQSDPAMMPIEDATVLWSEAQTPFVPVASIVIPRQQFQSEAQRAFCENLSYTPWHSLPANRPVGNINRIRRVVYEAISKLRHRLNSVARREPTGNERFQGSPTW